MAAVDYRFFRVTAGEIAVIVDVIRRAGQPDLEIRASYWAGSAHRVARSRSAAGAPTDLPATDDVAGEIQTSGAAGDVRWDLVIRPGPTLVDPRGGLLRHLRAFDLQLVSRPEARFSGWIEIAGERTAVEPAGLLCHYWGRRLPQSWYWVSANGSGVVIDAAVGQSRLWGLPWLRLPVGYVFIQSGGKRTFHICPLNSVVRARGGPAAFTIEAWRPGESLHLACRGDPAAYNDLGEGISQTLRGDCEVAGVASLSGTVGLEARDTRSSSPHRRS